MIKQTEEEWIDGNGNHSIPDMFEWMFHELEWMLSRQERVPGTPEGKLLDELWEEFGQIQDADFDKNGDVIEGEGMDESWDKMVDIFNEYFTPDDMEFLNDGNILGWVSKEKVEE